MNYQVLLLKSDIEQAYLLQQISVKRAWKSVEREQMKRITKDNDFIQIISGIRRCGKSTLLHQLMETYQKIAYFNFEDPRVVSFEVTDFAKLDEIMPVDGHASVFFQ
jgi:predicted AAA+ superfamily ATPase